MTEVAPPNAFIGKRESPSDSDLRDALGRVKPLWVRLIAELATESGVEGQEWRCYSSKSGWALRLKRGKRTIVWLAPSLGCFNIAFILGDKAMIAARQLKLAAGAAEALAHGVKYPEGTGVRLIIRSSRDLPGVKKLAAVKLEN